MEEKLLTIINHYGVNHQLRKLNEEVFELNEAIIIGEYPYSPIQDIDHIAEEIADIEVMLLQFKEYYRIDGNDILKYMKFKIDRQIERLKEEKQ